MLAASKLTPRRWTAAKLEPYECGVPAVGAKRVSVMNLSLGSAGPSPVGENVAQPGDRLPGVPAHLFKAGVESPLLWSFRGSLDLLASAEREE